MTKGYSQETQRELFQEFGGGSEKEEKRLPFVQRTQRPILITTSVEQIVFAGMALVLIGCFVFFLGVLRGRSLRKEETGLAIERVSPIPKAPPLAPVSVRPVPRREILGYQAAAPAKEAKKKRIRVPTLQESKPYTLQLVTYKKKDWAEKEADKLREKGYLVTIIPSGDYYQVCVGYYASKEEAQRDLKLFRSKYKDCFLRRHS